MTLREAYVYSQGKRTSKLNSITYKKFEYEYMDGCYFKSNKLFSRGSYTKI